MESNRKDLTKELVWEEAELLKNAAFITYHGKNSAQHQFVKLICSSEPCDHTNKSFIGTTGERITLTIEGINVIPRERIWIGEEIGEVDFNSGGIFTQGATIIANSIRGIEISDNTSHEYKPLYPINQPGSLKNFKIDRSKASMGQETDIAEHEKKYDSLRITCPDVKNIIVYGISRGAATTFAALARHKNKYHDIKLCILEGPPASITDVGKEKIGSDLTNMFYSLNNPLTKLVLGDQHSIEKNAQAQAYIESFPDHIPLVIVTSQKDEVVPHRSSMKFALRVAAQRITRERNEGKNIAPVYLLQLDNPGHNDYTTDKSADNLRYQNCIHAIYRQNKLSYIKNYADQGQIELETAELTNGLLKKIIILQDEFRKHKDMKQQIKLRFDAFNLLNQQLNTDVAVDIKKRMALLCSVMPVFTKELDDKKQHTNHSSVSHASIFNKNQPSDFTKMTEENTLNIKKLLLINEINNEIEKIKTIQHGDFDITLNVFRKDHDLYIAKYNVLNQLLIYLFFNNYGDIEKTKTNTINLTHVIEKNAAYKNNQYMPWTSTTENLTNQAIEITEKLLAFSAVNFCSQTNS